MAFCKVCACGEKIVFERRLGFPDNCPSCQRELVDFLTYNEDDPRVAELLKEHEKSNNSVVNNDNEIPLVNESNANPQRYIFRLENGNEIDIPEEGCIIGRTEVGAEMLAEYGAVSRQHLRVTPRRNIGVIVEDISKYGTLVDGQRIIKNSPVRVANGTRITLCNVEMVLIQKRSEE